KCAASPSKSGTSTPSKPVSFSLARIGKCSAVTWVVQSSRFMPVFIVADSSLCAKRVFRVESPYCEVTKVHWQAKQAMDLVKSAAASPRAGIEPFPGGEVAGELQRA